MRRRGPFRHRTFAFLMGTFAVIIALGIATRPAVSSSPPAGEAASGALPAAPMVREAARPFTPFHASGSGIHTTESFDMPNRWDLAWSYDCTSFGQAGNFIVNVYNDDGSPSRLAGVNQLGTMMAGTEHFHQTGEFYLEINSECAWHVAATDASAP